MDQSRNPRIHFGPGWLRLTALVALSLTIIGCDPIRQDQGHAINSTAMTYGPGDPNNPIAIRPVRGNERLHYVERGQSLFQIARRYTVTPQQIAELNQLDANYAIYAGTFLIIPSAPEEFVGPPDPFEPNPVEPVESAPLAEPES